MMFTLWSSQTNESIIYSIGEALSLIIRTPIGINSLTMRFKTLLALQTVTRYTVICSYSIAKLFYYLDQTTGLEAWRGNADTNFGCLQKKQAFCNDFD